MVDGLLPATQDLWHGRPVAERRRPLRHIQPYRDAHRHRIAAQVAACIAGALDREQRSVRTARIAGCGARGEASNAVSGLVAALLDAWLDRIDPLGLGPVSAPDGVLVDARGVPSDRLFTLDPPRKGDLWETVAVPELRVQAATLADRLLRA